MGFPFTAVCLLEDALPPLVAFFQAEKTPNNAILQPASQENKLLKGPLFCLSSALHCLRVRVSVGDPRAPQRVHVGAGGGAADVTRVRATCSNSNAASPPRRLFTALQRATPPVFDFSPRQNARHGIPGSRTHANTQAHTGLPSQRCLYARYFVLHRERACLYSPLQSP